MSAAMKKCKDCGEYKDLTNFYKTGRYFQPRCKPCHCKQSVLWAKKNPERVRFHRKTSKRVGKYGLSSQDYWRLVAEHDGKCAICGGVTVRKGEQRDLDVDHCHKTGKIRGLLCSMCNKAIGMFKDSPEALRRAASYLEAAK